MSVQYPGESAPYRTARNALLAEEVALRQQIEKVAELRRQLPPGGATADYTFTAPDQTATAMTDLFTTPRNTLAVYSLMYRPDAASPCPMCVSLLDGLAGQACHVGQRVDLVVVSAATPQQLHVLSEARGWSELRLFSTQGTTYQRDYHAEAPDGSQLPMMNVFRKTPQGIHHTWGSESFYADIDGQPRHVDQLWPLWSVLDLTPDGRGTDWYPALSYAS